MRRVTRRSGSGGYRADLRARRMRPASAASAAPRSSTGALPPHRGAPGLIRKRRPVRGRGPAARGEAVAAIARAVGLGERQLHRRSLDAFGYGPGRSAASCGCAAPWPWRAGLPFAEVACVAGYADQAHLSREVRAPAGTTLRAYATGADGANSETPPPSGSSTTA